jgi:hypothetical protein
MTNAEKVETPDGVFWVKPLKYEEIRKLLKDANVTRIKLIGNEIPQVEIDIADIQYYLLVYSLTDESGNPIPVERINNFSIDTVNILTAKALELTPIFRFLSGNIA